MSFPPSVVNSPPRPSPSSFSETPLNTYVSSDAFNILYFELKSLLTNRAKETLNQSPNEEYSTSMPSGSTSLIGFQAQ